jgi:hypothetical protein
MTEFPNEIESEEFQNLYDECSNLINDLQSIQSAIEEGDGEKVDELTEKMDKSAGQLRMTALRKAQRCK